jgi:hypothetical protein
MARQPNIRRLARQARLRMFGAQRRLQVGERSLGCCWLYFVLLGHCAKRLREDQTRPSNIARGNSRAVLVLEYFERAVCIGRSLFWLPPPQFGLRFSYQKNGKIRRALPDTPHRRFIEVHRILLEESRLHGQMPEPVEEGTSVVGTGDVIIESGEDSERSPRRRTLRRPLPPTISILTSAG